MCSPKSVFAFLLALATIAFGTTVDESQCDCYVTNGTKPTYYAGHMFFDFRNLSQFAAGVPDLIDTIDGNANAGFSSDYFKWGSDFTQTWGLQKWSSNGGNIFMQNTYNNVYIQANTDDEATSNTYLTMRTARGDGFQSAAEFVSHQKYQYASMRMLSRTFGSTGACGAMFTYLSGSELANVQESDIEVLTKDANNIIHYTNQPSYKSQGGLVAGASNKVALQNGLNWSNWTAHRLDWTADEVLWYVDGQQTASNSFQVPQDASSLVFNAWSNGGSWTGTMPVGGVAYQEIQWIEILYGSADMNNCSRVCSIDNTSELGTPVYI
ncbi:concanavalin A-like lectin/glucanase domain-containing protein [Mariannaea sp. PMI_226]|nr:concanavalin A-like lectin/glucanase domain-containing protein [Mariannaea sp. PMI_226]